MHAGADVMMVLLMNMVAFEGMAIEPVTVEGVASKGMGVEGVKLEGVASEGNAIEGIAFEDPAAPVTEDIDSADPVTVKCGETVLRPL